MNTKAQNPKHVFGPVPSRRLGRSLGVDLVPFKTCTYDCIYFKEKIKFQNMANVEVTFPVIADIKMDVARLYGMVQPNSSDSQAVRAVFFIDPKAKIRSVLFYP